jgi:hypothetical protein
MPRTKKINKRKPDTQDALVDHIRSNRARIAESDIQRIEQKYVTAPALLKQIAELKQTIVEQKQQINELLEEPEGEIGHLYLMCAEPLSYKNNSGRFPYEDMAGHQNPFKISMTGNDQPSTSIHQTNNMQKLTIIYQSEFKFTKYKECKKLFKERYVMFAADGGSDWFIGSLETARNDLENIILETQGTRVPLVNI